MLAYQYAVIITAALLPSYLLRVTVFGVPTNLLEILILISAGLTFAFYADSKRLASLKESAQSLLVPVVLTTFFMAAAIVSTVISPHPATSLGILKSWIIIPVIFGATVFLAARDKTARRHIISALLLSGTAMALVGISQAGGLPRARGLYDVPNSLALFIAPLIPLAVLSGRRLRKYLAAVMGAALLLTQSLGGILAVAAVLSAGGFMLLPPLLKSPGGLLRVINILGAGLTIAAIAGGYLIYTGRAEYMTSPWQDDKAVNSISVRQQLWSVSSDLIKENPALGIGLGVFEPLYQEKLHERFAEHENNGKKAPIPEFVFRDPHNWILSFWLNTGLLGLIAFAGVNFWILRRAYVKRRIITKEAAGLLSALAVILIFGLTDTVYWKNDLAVLQWIVISLWCACEKN